uniref:Protein kinase domain-containing protein n=2 Tax=Amphora coffeiformis TaxID=265554 RepID=A0A6S8IK00_9STRA|mmetsp:Transcript_15556/g.29703  ORF Transcript_15556/g.29703 Transcript_15556/m.29703 type:complete len:948 (+) Transcript_15556:379-3222(+)|eukprot:scaffold34609_cov146-Amphora_coffeaeformis.AAC.15
MTVVRKKLAVPHYLAGLGDGRAQPHGGAGVSVQHGPEPEAEANEEAEEEEDDAYISHLRKTVRDRTKKGKPPVGAAVQMAAAARQRLQYPQQHQPQPWGAGEAASKYYQHHYAASLPQHHDHPASIGPWQIAAFALLGAVILLSALFLHILADSSTNTTTSSTLHNNNNNTNMDGANPKESHTTKHKHQRRRPRRRSLYKKKTDDYWSSDDETDVEADLLSESVRGQGVYHRTDSQEGNDNTLIMNPSFHNHHDPYYNPHPYREQQSRQRKNSLTQPQTPIGSSASRNIYQAPAYRYPTPNNRNTAAASFSPSMVHRTVATPAMAGPPPPPPPPLMPTRVDPTNTLNVGAAFSTVSSLESFSHHDSSSIMMSGNYGSTSHSNSSGSQQQQLLLPHQTTMLQPRPSSLRSSGSGQRKSSSPTVTIQEPIREEEQTPQPGPREMVVGSPPGPVRRDSSMIEKTPRVRNGKVITEAMAMAQTPSPGRNSSHIQVDNGTEDSDFVMPFLPNLNPSMGSQAQQQPQQHQQVPEPVNMGDLHLYTRMESGSVFWQRPQQEDLSPHPLPLPQVVQTPDRLPAPPLLAPTPPDHPPSLRGNISEHFMEMVGSIDDSESLDSNDPRKNIQHKRPDLLMGTDSAASLQGAVNFDDLQLQEVIGGGGFGQVWKAMWNGTPVAVKVLTGSAQAHQVPRAILEEFAAEINLLKGMRHPNICLYMGACLAPPNRAIITELAANGSLWDALRLPLSAPYTACDGLTRHAWPMSLYQPDPRHGVPPSMSRTVSHVPPKSTWPWILVKKVACGSARGMNYLHSGKPPVLHRDLKSANILLDESYTPKVCDFGLSRLKAQDRSMTGNCGTVQWMAPEVLANQAYNEKADIYSYGIILWELLTRQCPYDDMSAIQCALAVLNRNHRPEIPRWCPPALQVLIRSCLKKNPEERPNFTEILQALDEMP